MQIEIVTTKKKLTKGIIGQMRVAKLRHLKHGIVLGYVINVLTDSYKVIIIKYEDDYYTISGNFKKGEMSLYRQVGKWTHYIKFTSMELCSEFWEHYSLVLKKAEHFYI